jgi:hypothetical protein
MRPTPAPTPRRCARDLLAILLLLLIQGLAQAAPALRFSGQPPAQPSTASSFSVVAELYETSTGARITASGVVVTLRLLRCPGFPSPCSVVIVNNDFTTASTTAGLASFNALNIASGNEDYYFAAVASGYQTGTSAVFDVSSAQLAFMSGIPDPLSTASRFTLTVQVLRGAGLERDPLADNLPLRLRLLRCPGFPASCSVVVVDPAFADGLAFNGQTTFGPLSITTAGDDYYIAAALGPGANGSANAATTNVLDVDPARFRIVPLPGPLLSTASRLPLRVEVRRGSGEGSIDIHADNVPVRLSLLECPGFPASCSVNVLNPNFANGNTFNGVEQFNNLRLTGVGEDRYFAAQTPSAMGILPATSLVFDVAQARARVMSPTPDRQALVPFNIDVAILAGSEASAPIDALAGGHLLRLDSYACPGFPAVCTPQLLQTGFGNANSVGGVAEMSGLVYGSPGEDRYWLLHVPGDGLIQASTTGVFDVLPAPPEIFANGFEAP